MNKPQEQGQLTIGALAGRTGFNVSAIRYYEQVGLIAPAARSAGGHRVYGAQVQEVLTLVRHCRDFGFSIDETRTLVSLSTSASSDCTEARDIAQAHLDAVSAKLAELQNLQRSLSNYVQACTNGCAGGPAPECTILKDLSLQPGEPATPGCCG